MQVLEFKKGRLQNLYWKRDGCAKCSGNSNYVCLNNQDCALRTTNCKPQGSVDCSLGIQLTFSGTDKHFSALNSWYEVQNLRQYSLYGLYSNLKDSLTSQYSNIFWLWFGWFVEFWISSYVVIFSSSLFQMVQTFLFQLMLIFVVLFRAILYKFIYYNSYLWSIWKEIKMFEICPFHYF